MAWQIIASKDSVPEGEVKVFQVGRKSLAVANVGGEFHAIDNVCSHDRGPLGEGALVGDQVECPRHGATFDLKTGRATRFPAVVPVKAYKTRVEGDEVQVDV